MILNKITSLSAVAMTLVLGIAPLANANTLANAKQEGKLSFGYIVDEAPYSSISESASQPEGYAIELCNKVAQSIKAQPGYADLEVTYQPTSIKEGLNEVQNGNIDLLCGPFVETLSRRERVSFSIPIAIGGLSAVINHNADAALKQVLAGEKAHSGPTWRATVNRGLANHTYAVHEGEVAESWVRNKIKNLGVVANVVTAKTHAEGIKLVSEGKADAYFADKLSLVVQLNKSALNNVQLTEHIYEIATEHFVLGRNEDDFRTLVDKALSELYKSDDFVPLYTQYFGVPSEATMAQFQRYIIAE